MAKVIQVDPADIAHDGEPTFKKGVPDSSRDVIVMKVLHKSEYQAASEGDILQHAGACYEVVGAQGAMDVNSESQIDGVIIFYVRHKGTIPC